MNEDLFLPPSNQPLTDRNSSMPLPMDICPPDNEAVTFDSSTTSRRQSASTYITLVDDHETHIANFAAAIGIDVARDAHIVVAGVAVVVDMVAAAIGIDVARDAHIDVAGVVVAVDMVAAAIGIDVARDAHIAVAGVVVAVDMVSVATAAAAAFAAAAAAVAAAVRYEVCHRHRSPSCNCEISIPFEASHSRPSTQSISFADPRPATP